MCDISSIVNIAAVLNARCPRCRKGPMFKKNLSAYPFIGETLQECPVCGQWYEPEPGFFTGAMYFGYAFSVAIFLTCGLAVYVLGHDPDAWVYITTTVVATFVLAPFNFRYSRVLMLHLFGGIEYKRIEN